MQSYETAIVQQTRQSVTPHHGSGVAMAWTAVDMSTPLLLQVITEIDANLTTFQGTSGEGDGTFLIPNLLLYFCILHSFRLAGKWTMPSWTSAKTLHFRRLYCGRVSCVFFLQLSRKLMMTEADLERSDKKADAADEYVALILFL